MVITLIENLFIAYEKFYIAEERNGLLLCINVLSMVLLLPIVHYASNISQFLLLFYIAAIRTTSFLLLALISFYKWNITPSVKIKPIYIAASLFAAVTFFVIM